MHSNMRELTRIDDLDFDYWCFIQTQEREILAEETKRIKAEKLINFADRKENKQNQNKCNRFGFFSVFALVFPYWSRVGFISLPSTKDQKRFEINIKINFYFL